MLGLWRWIQARRQARRRRSHRRVDVREVWPAVCDDSATLDEARHRFAAHVLGCPSWTTDIPYDRILARIWSLPVPERLRGEEDDA